VGIAMNMAHACLLFQMDNVVIVTQLVFQDTVIYNSASAMVVHLVIAKVGKIVRRDIIVMPLLIGASRQDKMAPVT